jgi:hypothetical protein
MGVAAAAVPVTAFVYKDQDYKQHMLMVEADLPVAPFLPQYQSTGTRQQRDQFSFAKGRRRGVIEANSEREAIDKASREKYANSWHAKREVEAANAVARCRNTEGVQVVKEKYTTAGAAAPCTKEEELAFPTSCKDGYQVQKYNVQGSR